MDIVKTVEDGWDCVPEFDDVLEYYDDMSHHIYEIRNCVRSSDLPDLCCELEHLASSILSAVRRIDTEQEFVTVEEL